MNRNAEDAVLVSLIERTIIHLQDGRGDRSGLLDELQETRERYAANLRKVPVVSGVLVNSRRESRQ